MAQLQYRFLVGDEETNSFLFHGYPFPMSPMKTKILFALLREQPLSATTLCAAVSDTLKPRTLAVHVHSINQKAMEIGGRRLIEFTDGAYRFNPEM